jgi:2-keto-4-pentenoate hydratase/2-oxohepta-3-ene-1,7-dioic acid hydratase in catechol pathway
MSAFKLLSYGAAPKQARAGVLIGDDIYDAAKLTGKEAWHTVVAILEEWPTAEAAIDAAVGKASVESKVGAAADVELQAPVLWPGSIFCAASNYRDHSEAMARKSGRPVEPDPRTLGIKPFHFLKSPRQAVVAPGADLTMPSYAERLDWEIELAAVIGRPAKNVPVAQALDYVAGYMVSNDVSVRDATYMRRPNVPEASPFNTDFVGAKGFDNSCILGPWITPAAQIGDPTNLAMKLWIDDELMQDSNSGKMIFSTAEQIAYLSERLTLLPGDVVLTGTPAGTGAERGRFLKKGETIRMWIENIGETRNNLV